MVAALAPVPAQHNLGLFDYVNLYERIVSVSMLLARITFLSCVWFVHWTNRIEFPVNEKVPQTFVAAANIAHLNKLSWCGGRKNKRLWIENLKTNLGLSKLDCRNFFLNFWSTRTKCLLLQFSSSCHYFSSVRFPETVKLLKRAWNSNYVKIGVLFKEPFSRYKELVPFLHF